MKFNLTDNTFEPYNKPNNLSCYVHVSSNHPKTVLKAIGKGVNKQLNSILFQHEKDFGPAQYEGDGEEQRVGGGAEKKLQLQSRHAQLPAAG